MSVPIPQNSNRSRRQYCTAKYTAWPVLSHGEDVDYTSTSQKHRNPTSKATSTYWFIGNDLRDLSVQPPDVDKSLSSEYIDIVEGIVYAVCAKSPSLRRERMLLVTRGPVHSFDLVEEQDLNWDIDTSRLRPGTEVILYYVSKGKYQRPNGSAQHIKQELLEFREPGYRHGIEISALKNALKALLADSGRLQNPTAAPTPYDWLQSLVAEFNAGNSQAQAGASPGNPSNLGQAAPSPDDNADTELGISEDASGPLNQVSPAAEQRTSATADESVQFKIWYAGPNIPPSRLPENCAYIAGSGDPSKVLQEIIEYHCNIVNAIDLSYGSRPISLNDIFIATGAWDGAEHIPLDAVKDSSGPIWTSCVLGWYDQADSGNVKTIREERLPGYSNGRECFALFAMRDSLRGTARELGAEEEEEERDEVEGWEANEQAKEGEILEGLAEEGTVAGDSDDTIILQSTRDRRSEGTAEDA